MKKHYIHLNNNDTNNNDLFSAFGVLVICSLSFYKIVQQSSGGECIEKRSMACFPGSTRPIC